MSVLWAGHDYGLDKDLGHQIPAAPKEITQKHEGTFLETAAKYWQGVFRSSKLYIYYYHDVVTSNMKTPWTVL